MKKYFLLSILTLVQNGALAAGVPSIIFTPSSQKEKSVITLSFTGDILIHKPLYEYADEGTRLNFSKIWKNINPLLQKADIAYGNLEGPTALGITSKLRDAGDIGTKYDGEVYSGTNMVFNYHPNIIDELKKSGFSILSTSNNHTFDRGSIGIDKTVDAMNDKGMTFVGTRKKGSSNPLYTITAKNGFNIAWIACSEMLNGFKDKHSQVLLCYDQATQITTMIKDLISSRKADAVIVLPHWGVEYKHEPNEQQKKFARLYLEAGATAVVGSHPHVLQPAEKYITKDGRETFIAYSLGNFIAFQKDVDRKASAFIYLKLAKSEEGKTWIKHYRYEPTLRIDRTIYHANKMKEVLKHEEPFFGRYIAE